MRVCSHVITRVALHLLGACIRSVAGMVVKASAPLPQQRTPCEVVT